MRWKLDLMQALEDLPGERAHNEMSPLKRKLDVEELKISNDYRESAVSIVLYEIEDELNFLLIQRPKYNGAHSGQIALPGGKMDRSDNDLEHTARRESWEEVGIQQGDLEKLGELTPIYIPVSKFRVSPFVFWWKNNYDLAMDEREVDEILHVPISDLLNEKRKKLTNIDVGQGRVLKDIPFFDLGNKRVWGATAIILNEFKMVLNNMNAYFL